MSYSKVKKIGFPHLDKFQRAYHIVREADLLCAYDFDRCMIYSMKKKHTDISTAFQHADDLFQSRVLKQINDGLFFTRYANRESYLLHSHSIQRIQHWKLLLSNKLNHPNPL
jgi:hypothetical protein